MKELNLKPRLNGRAQASRSSLRAARPFGGGSQENVSYASDVKEALDAKGYSFSQGKDIRVPWRLRPALQAFLSECIYLPVDNYSGEGTRKRRHTRLLLFPWKQQLLRWPKNTYCQDAAANRDAAGAAREFRAANGNDAGE